MENPAYRDQIARAFAAMEAAPASPWRPAFHLSPPAGTLADPNGLCQVGPDYHIFYINSPLACQTSARTPCVWAHYTTRDFVRYRRLPIALYPDTRWDRDGVYSGSALCRDGTLYLYYTGNVRHSGDYDYIHAGREQNVLRAASADGVHFADKTLLMTNADFPAGMTCHVRDPQLLEEDGRLLMLLGGRTNEDEGCILVYESEDGEQFRLVNTLRTAQPFGYMWECPDYAVVDGQPLLLCCPQGIPHERYEYQNPHQCGCFPLSGEIGRAAALGGFRSFDYGFDCYAARTLKAGDGRRILIGWMGMSEADYGRTPSASCGWDQMLALPRELHWRGGQLCQTPLAELRSLRAGCEEQDGRHSPLAWQGRRCELLLRPREGQDLTVRLYEDAQLSYSAAGGELTLELGPICGAGRGVRRMKLPRLTELDLWLDGSALEVFINGGQAVMTSRVFGESDVITASPFTGNITFCPMHGFTIEDGRGDGV